MAQIPANAQVTHWFDEQRQLVLERDKLEGCIYCGEKRVGYLQVDHVIPVSAGGLSYSSNLVTSCNTCNSTKGSDIHPTYILRALTYLFHIGEAVNWEDNIQESHKLYNKIPIDCICGKSFTRSHFNQKYCSPACRQQAFKISRGQNQPAGVD